MIKGNIYLCKPYGDNFSYTNIGKAEINDNLEMEIELDLFPILIPDAYLRFSRNDNPYNGEVAIKKRVLLKTKVEYQGEEKVISRNAGYCLINKVNSQIIDIKFYLKIIPFKKNIVYHMVDTMEDSC